MLILNLLQTLSLKISMRFNRCHPYQTPFFYSAELRTGISSILKEQTSSIYLTTENE